MVKLLPELSARKMIIACAEMGRGGAEFIGAISALLWFLALHRAILCYRRAAPGRPQNGNTLTLLSTFL